MRPSRDQIRRLLGAVIGLAALLTVDVAPAQDLEAAVKAAYLVKFAPFVTWPVTAFDTPDAPLAICVQGLDPFGGLLERSLAGQRVGAHPFVLRRVARVDAVSGCHIAYLGGSPGQTVAQALAAVRGRPVLTVTDQARGGVAGVVHLVTAQGRVRFDIDAGQAQEDGLAISSKLLALAIRVRR